MWKKETGPSVRKVPYGSHSAVRTERGRDKSGGGVIYTLTSEERQRVLTAGQETPKVTRTREDISEADRRKSFAQKTASHLVEIQAGQLDPETKQAVIKAGGTEETIVYQISFRKHRYGLPDDAKTLEGMIGTGNITVLLPSQGQVK